METQPDKEAAFLLAPPPEPSCADGPVRLRLHMTEAGILRYKEEETNQQILFLTVGFVSGAARKPEVKCFHGNGLHADEDSDNSYSTCKNNLKEFPELFLPPGICVVDQIDPSGFCRWFF